MDAVETKVLSDPWDVDPRLLELKLTREGLLAARDVALAERANATPFHPANAAGTFAYQHGTWALRDQFVGEDYVEDRADGVEAIFCEALKVRVAFANVDLACDINHQPKPRSNKGAGAERASGGTLFGDLPAYAPRPSDGPALYYLMVDETGAAELTRPIIKGGTFTASVERLFLSLGGDGDGEDLQHHDGDDVADNFDPQVARK
jgi:hypothetical protein